MLIVPYFVNVLKGLYMNHTPKRRCSLFCQYQNEQNITLSGAKIRFITRFTPPEC